MNPLTQIKNTQKATRREVEAGISDSASWHAKFKHSAYVFTGGLDYGLTEGDLLAVFAQYGEVVDLNLIRDKDNGKSKGFAFIAYEDQRSTVLAVDNLNGAKVVGRTIRVEHVDNYKKRKAEIEGEDPNAVGADGEDERGGGPAAGAAGGERQANQSGNAPGGPGPPRRGRSPPAAAPSSRPAGLSAEPWAASGSIFSLLEEARQLEAAKQAARKPDPREKELAAGSSGRGLGGERPSGKSRGEQQRQADRDRERDRDRDRDRDGDRERSRSAGPSGPSFGPPRPPPRQPAADEPGPGPSSLRGGGGRYGDPRDGPGMRDGDREEREGPRGRGGDYRRSERDVGPDERRRAGSSRSPGRGRDSGRDRGDADRGREPERGRDREADGERDRGARARGRERSRSREREWERERRGGDRERGRDREQ